MIQNLQDVAVAQLLRELTSNFGRIDCKESGWVAETAVQLLSDDYFKALAAIILSDNSQMANEIASAFVAKISQKLDIQIDSYEKLYNAMKNFIVLVNYENLRRKGYLNYVWTNDMFSLEPNQGYSELTAAGKAMAQRQILEAHTGVKQ